MVLNGGRDWLLIGDAVGDKAANLMGDLRQELRHLHGVLLMAVGHARRHNLALVVHAKMQFFQRRHVFALCFGVCHSPWPHTFKPVLSTITDSGPWGARSTCCRMTSVALRRESVV